MSTPEEALEEEVRREIWSLHIPTVFSLDINEVTALEPPSPLFVMVPRLSYLPLLYEKIKAHFLSSTSVRYDEIWLSMASTPLKWHLPAGVLFDLYGSRLNLPWEITVHFQGFPSTKILRCSGEDATKYTFMNILKEANHLKFGDGSKISGLALEEQNDLWEGTIAGKYDQFWNINKKLIPKEKKVKYVPMRFCFPNQPMIQEPVTLQTEGKDMSLAEVLKKVLPQDYNTVSEKDENMNVIIQGIKPPLWTPILWLAIHCSHPDNFLYIICK